jgi:hypothetical protein
MDECSVPVPRGVHPEVSSSHVVRRASKSGGGQGPDRRGALDVLIDSAQAVCPQRAQFLAGFRGELQRYIVAAPIFSP